MMNELIGRILSNRYRVEAFLGKGGMAEVYKVWDRMRSVHLAIKVLNANLAANHMFLDHFRSEAKALANLQHPNIVRFYSLEQDDNAAFIVMDYVAGSTLRDEIQSHNVPLASNRILDVMRSICSALNYAHELGYVHCDIKPANIMINTNGVALVTDFGIARLAGNASTAVGGRGTPAYMAPEQILGETPTRAADIYALGILLYEMLTGGVRPFNGQSPQTTGTTTQRIRWEQTHLFPPSPRQYNPNISRELEAIILRCLEKEATKRYPTAQSLLSAVEGPLLRAASLRSGVTNLHPASRPEETVRNMKALPDRSQRAKNVWVWSLVVIPVIVLAVLMAGSKGGGSSFPGSQAATTHSPTPTPYFTPTPAWLSYRSSNMSFTIEYPPDWVYQEDSSRKVVVFASSKETLAANDIPSSGAALAVGGGKVEDNYPQAGLPYTPKGILDQFLSQNFKNIHEMQSAQPIYINSHLATTALYGTNADSGVDAVLYATVVLDNDYFTVMLGLTPEAEWLKYRPILERMRNSFVLSPP